MGTGKGGAAHEHAIKTFNEKADITIFCWTESNRLYHKKYILNPGTIRHHLLQNKENSEKVFLAANAYYQRIFDKKLAKERQIRDLFWFDHCVLEKVNKTFLHLFCFENTYFFKNGINTSLVISKKFNPVYSFNEFKVNVPIYNHLTPKDNKELAEQVLDFLKNSC